MLTLVRARASRLAAVSAVIFIVTLAGCGSVDPVDTFEVRAAPLSAEQACAPSAATICEHAQSCSPYLFDHIYTSVATCTALFTALCVDRYRGEGAATEIADCSAAVSSVSCDRLFVPILLLGYDVQSELLSSCPVTPGRFADGERCLRDGDCATGRCAWHGECGKCVPPRPVELLELGQACTTDEACLSRWCAAGKCSPPAKLGEACGDQPCDLLGGLTCGSDLKCRPVETVHVGWPCSWFEYCDVGASCEPDDQFSFSGNGTCKKLPSAGVGEPCTFGCSPQLRCVSGSCVASPKTEPTSCKAAASPK